MNCYFFNPYEVFSIKSLSHFLNIDQKMYSNPSVYIFSSNLYFVIYIALAICLSLF